MINLQQDILKEVRGLFNNAPNLKAAIQKAIEENTELKKQAEEFFKEKVTALKNILVKQIQERSGMKLIQTRAEIRPEAIKDIAFQLRGEIAERLLFVAGTVFNGKPLLTVMLSDDLVAAGLNASTLVREGAKLIHGGGGGQPHFAQAGGKEAEGLSAAIDKIIELAEK